MQQINLSQINQTYLNNKNNEQNKIEQPKNSQRIENKNKKLELALCALAVAGVAISAGIAICSHKTNSSPIKALRDIDFNKGIAKLKKNGANYTGQIKDTLKNGDKIVIEYKDGILQSSTRSGEVNFEKVYETLGNGNHKITTTQDGKTSKIILEEIKDKVNKVQDDFKALLNNKKNLTAEEFEKQMQNLTYLSKSQNKELLANLYCKLSLEENISNSRCFSSCFNKYAPCYQATFEALSQIEKGNYKEAFGTIDIVFRNNFIGGFDNQAINSFNLQPKLENFDYEELLNKCKKSSIENLQKEIINIKKHSGNKNPAAFYKGLLTETEQDFFALRNAVKNEDIKDIEAKAKNIKSVFDKYGVFPLFYNDEIATKSECIQLDFIASYVRLPGLYRYKNKNGKNTLVCYSPGWALDAQ